MGFHRSHPSQHTHTSSSFKYYGKKVFPGDFLKCYTILIWNDMSLIKPSKIPTLRYMRKAHCFFLRIRVCSWMASYFFAGCVAGTRRCCSGRNPCLNSSASRWSLVTTSPTGMWVWDACHFHLPARVRGPWGSRGWWNPKMNGVCTLKSPCGRSACKTPVFAFK